MISTLALLQKGETGCEASAMRGNAPIDDHGGIEGEV